MKDIPFLLPYIMLIEPVGVLLIIKSFDLYK